MAETLPQINAASPLNASDDVRQSFAGGTTEVRSFALDNMPSNFDSMDLITLHMEVQISGITDDTIQVNTRVMNGAQVLAAEDSAGTFSFFRSYTANQADTLATDSPGWGYTNRTATKADWDNAVLEVQQNYQQSMSNDGAFMAIDHAYITGTFNVSSVATPTLTGSITPSGVQSSAARQPTIHECHPEALFAPRARLGPWKLSTGYYYVSVDGWDYDPTTSTALDGLVIFKSADPAVGRADDWSLADSIRVQDNGAQPWTTREVNWLASAVQGTDIHIAAGLYQHYFDSGTSTQHQHLTVRYYKFDTTTDTFTITHETVFDYTTASNTNYGFDIQVRSTGVPLVIFRDNLYWRTGANAWSSVAMGTQFAGGDSLPRMVMDSSDRAHIVTQFGADVFVRTRMPDNTWGSDGNGSNATFVYDDANFSNVDAEGHSVPYIWNDGGTDRFAVLIFQNYTEAGSVSRFLVRKTSSLANRLDVGVTWSSSNIYTVTNPDPNYGTGYNTTIFAAVREADDTHYFLYKRDDDTYWQVTAVDGATWGNETQILNPGVTNPTLVPEPRVYDHNGDKLAYLWWDLGAKIAYYQEHSIGPQTASIAGAASSASSSSAAVLGNKVLVGGSAAVAGQASAELDVIAPPVALDGKVDSASQAIAALTVVTIERVAPLSILFIENLSGNVAAIQDDPDAPDGNWLVLA